MKQKPSSLSYSVQADVIRIIAIVGVVLIHSIYPIYSRPDFMGGVTWWLALFLNSISRVAIPFFIMLSGYFMLSKKESVDKTLHRTWKRLVFPLITWFALYVVWDARFLGKTHSFIHLLSMTLTASVYHLYFLVILAGLYVFLPLWRYVVEQEAQYARQLAIISFAVGFVYFFFQYTLFSTMNIFNAATIWIPYLGYFLLGHFFRDQMWFSTKTMILLSIFGFLLTFFGSYLNFLWSKDGDTFFWRNGVSYFEEPLSINVFLLSTMSFQLLIKNKWLEKVINKISFLKIGVKEMAAASFAVYLVHFMVINYLDMRKSFAFEFLHTDLLTYFLTRTTLILIASFITGSMLVRVPILKKIVGL